MARRHSSFTGGIGLPPGGFKIPQPLDSSPIVTRKRRGSLSSASVIVPQQTIKEPMPLALESQLPLNPRVSKGGVGKRVRRGTVIGSMTTGEMQKVMQGRGKSIIEQVRNSYGLEESKYENLKDHQKNMYTDQALLKREILRFDLNVRKVLNMWWNVIDSDGNHKIELEEYIVLNGVLYKAVAGTFTEEEGRKLALNMWTDDLEASTYAKFLMDLLKRVTYIDEHGVRKFKHLDDIVTIGAKKRSNSLAIDRQDSRVKQGERRLFLARLMELQDKETMSWSSSEELKELLNIKPGGHALSSEDCTRLAIAQIERVGGDLITKGRLHHHRRASFLWASALDGIKSKLDSADSKIRMQKRNSRLAMLAEEERSDEDSWSDTDSSTTIGDVLRIHRNATVTNLNIQQATAIGQAGTSPTTSVRYFGSAGWINAGGNLGPMLFKGTEFSTEEQDTSNSPTRPKADIWFAKWKRPPEVAKLINQLDKKHGKHRKMGSNGLLSRTLSQKQVRTDNAIDAKFKQKILGHMKPSASLKRSSSVPAIDRLASSTRHRPNFPRSSRTNKPSQRMKMCNQFVKNVYGKNYSQNYVNTKVKQEDTPTQGIKGITSCQDRLGLHTSLSGAFVSVEQEGSFISLHDPRSQFNYEDNDEHLVDPENSLLSLVSREERDSSKCFLSTYTKSAHLSRGLQEEEMPRVLKGTYLPTNGACKDVLEQGLRVHPIKTQYSSHSVSLVPHLNPNQMQPGYRSLEAVVVKSLNIDTLYEKKGKRRKRKKICSSSAQLKELSDNIAHWAPVTCSDDGQFVNTNKLSQEALNISHSERNRMGFKNVPSVKKGMIEERNASVSLSPYAQSESRRKIELMRQERARTPYNYVYDPFHRKNEKGKSKNEKGDSELRPKSGHSVRSKLEGWDERSASTPTKSEMTLERMQQIKMRHLQQENKRNE